VANNKEDIQSLKKDRLDGEEVAGPNVRVVTLQELPSALEGLLLWREFMYLATVLAETTNPNLASSAWIRF
jgi:hypothetical protein